MSSLSGIRVLDLSRVMSGPYCTAMLADLGADVIKLETPGSGDDSRHFGPYSNGASLYFSLLNRGKRSITLNLKDAKAKALARRLADSADVVVENFRPGVAARLGLDFATLRASNPRLVYLSISGFGQGGPFADRPAYDLIVQAMSGLMSITGQPEGQPTAVGESFADVATGMFGAFAVVSALFERSRTGKGTHIDVAMFDSLVAMQSTALARLAATGAPPARVGNRHPVTVPVDSFRARDGLFTLVAPSDAHFKRLAAMIGEPALAEDPRFAGNAARARHEAELKKAIERWTTQHTVDECVAACGRAEIPAGPVWDLRQATTSEHAIARGLLQSVEHPAFGSIAMVQQPARFSTAGTAAARREPQLGEHTSEILRELGLSDAEIEQLKSERAI